jgi:UDP-N-acetylglucosamine 2-epimerase
MRIEIILGTRAEIIKMNYRREFSRFSYNFNSEVV